jgi:hypothetical protein
MAEEIKQLETDIKDALKRQMPSIARPLKVTTPPLNDLSGARAAYLRDIVEATQRYFNRLHELAERTLADLNEKL